MNCPTELPWHHQEDFDDRGQLGAEGGSSLDRRRELRRRPLHLAANRGEEEVFLVLEVVVGGGAGHAGGLGDLVDGDALVAAIREEGEGGVHQPLAAIAFGAPPLHDDHRVPPKEHHERAISRVGPGRVLLWPPLDGRARGGV